MTWLAGVDIGGTNLKAVAASAAGEVLLRCSQPTADGSASPADWVRLIHEALSGFGKDLGGPPASIGVCAPGLAARDGRSIAHLPGKDRKSTRLNSSH